MSAVDWRALEARFAARPGALERVLGIAVETYAGMADRVRALALAGDRDGLARAAHGILGGASAIFATELAARAEAVVACGRAGGQDPAHAAAELAVSLEALLTEIATHRAGSPDSGPGG